MKINNTLEFIDLCSNKPVFEDDEIIIFEKIEKYGKI